MEGFTKEPQLVVLSSAPSVVSDRALAKFAGFLGVTAQLAPVHAELAGPPPEVLSVPATERCLALSLATLQILKSQTWFPYLLHQAKAILVYGFGVTGADGDELKGLTRGALASVVAVEGQTVAYHIHADGKHKAFPISGRSYTDEPPVAPLAFGPPSAARDGVDILISVNDQPCFISVPSGQGTLFLLSSPTLVDIDVPLAPLCSPRQWYAELLGLSIFLRSVFGRWCWTAPVRAATIVIDDPYLRKRYGFLRYETLAHELQQTGCSLTVGFIPYNYWRSDRRVTNMLRGQRDRFSITVHGCDHTNGEFASQDEMWLNQKARLALKRMDTHTRLTQMPYDHVMVFPQGRFSTKAIRALKECRYLAVVNTTQWPVDSAESPLTLRDVLDVAVTKYDNFAIFGRRHPHYVFDFAVDAFFQKPLLIGEHHAFFKLGFEPLRQIARELATFGTPPTWMPLHGTLTSSFVVKPMGPGHYAARFFTPLLRLRNTNGEPCLYSLMKPEAPGLVEAVTVGGERVPFEWQSGFLKCDVRLGAGDEREVKVLYRTAEKRTYHYRRSWSFQSRVFARRMLSDMRDNYLSKSDRLLATAERVKDSLFKDGIV
ncbi:MAG: hypothetical protein ACLPT4_06535 [Verrucomicrobiia bacterium]